jgi:uncharacterized OB-fold protein
MEISSAQPLPVPTAWSAPHWEGCRNGELLVQVCSDCQAYVFPPEEACTRCLSTHLVWSRSSGLGRIHTYTIVWRSQQPSFHTPYVPAVVELEEGWYMLTNIVGSRPEDVQIGLLVEVTFEQVSDEIALPKFRPLQRPR